MFRIKNRLFHQNKGLEDISSKNGKSSIENIIKYRISFTGLWWGPSGHNIHAIAKICIICFLLMNITQTIELILSTDDAKKLLGCFSILSFCGMGILKLYSLRQRRHLWDFLIQQSTVLETDELNNNDPLDVDSEDETSAVGGFTYHIDTYTEQFQSTSTLLFRMYSFTAVVFILSPFIEYGIYVYQDIPLEELPHILPAWSPLDTTMWGYSITIIIEIIASMYCVAVHVAFDLSVVGIMIFMCGQFSLLHDYSERIGGKGNKCDINKARDNRAHFRIAKCHHIQVIMLSTVSELGKLIQTVLGIYFVLATLTLCSVAVQFTWGELSTTQLICLLQYMSATLTQLYLFCHFGDAVLNKSAVGLGEGPYCAAYWCLSPKIRREIAILCVGMSRQCRLYAGIFNSLDLPSFIQVVRTAYSYYAVLRGTSE